MEYVLDRLDLMERKIDRILAALGNQHELIWVDSTEFCKLVGLKDTKALTYQMSKGIIHGDAVRNIGTIKRPRYRFHRTKAVDQFMNRLAKRKS